MEALGFKDPLVHLCRREYIINCNWKVFCDNYLDGGYHVQYAHKDLASNLNLKDYNIELHEVLSLQTCSPAAAAAAASGTGPPAASTEQAADAATSREATPTNTSTSTSSSSKGGLQRVAGGRDAAYAFVYPNFMANRYGPWLDTNVVIPMDAHYTNRCKVIFDYWLQPDALETAIAEHHSNSSSSNGCSGKLNLSTYEISAATTSSSSSSSDTSTSSSSGSSSQGDGGGCSGSRGGPGLAPAAMETAFVQESLASSHKVQVEDIALCEAVQQGLEEPSYGVGRYAPGPERPMFQFHQELYAAVMKGLTEV